MSTEKPTPQNSKKDLASFPLREVQEAIERIRFGTVQIFIQDGRIVQIDTTEKKRLV